jgi:hypothetical protein
MLLFVSFLFWDEVTGASRKEQEERCVAVRKEKGVQLHHASSLLNLALDKPPV